MNSPIVMKPTSASAVSRAIAVQASGAPQRAPERRARSATMTTADIAAGIPTRIRTHAPFTWTRVALPRVTPLTSDVEDVEYTGAISAATNNPSDHTSAATLSRTASRHWSDAARAFMPTG